MKKLGKMEEEEDFWSLGPGPDLGTPLWVPCLPAEPGSEGGVGPHTARAGGWCWRRSKLAAAAATPSAAEEAEQLLGPRKS